MVRIALLLAISLVAPASFASDWFYDCKSGSAYTDATNSIGLTPPHTACARPTSNADDTQILGVLCDNVDVQVFPDEDGDGTGATALTYQVQLCPSAESTLTAGEQDNACLNLSGASGTGSLTVQGAGVASRHLKLQIGGTFAGDPVIFVGCN